MEIAVLIPRYVSIASILSASLIVAASAPARAQLHGQHGSMPMEPKRTNIDKPMQKIDAAMASADAALRELKNVHDRLGPGATHDEIVMSMTGMFVKMRQIQTSLGVLSEDRKFARRQDPEFIGNPDAMKAFEEASRNFEQIASAFQAMAKGMGQVMKETAP